MFLIGLQKDTILKMFIPALFTVYPAKVYQYGMIYIKCDQSTQHNATQLLKVAEIGGHSMTWKDIGNIINKWKM